VRADVLTEGQDHRAVGSLSRDAARDEHGAVPFDVERLLRLWIDPLPEDDDAATDAFRQLYADPVTVNGAPLTAADMVARARAMQGALEQPERDVLAVVDARDTVAVAFRLGGRHVGPLDTPVGRLPATGVRIDLRVVDILSFTDGRISEIWMVGDWLTPLADAGLVEVLTKPAAERTAGGTEPAVHALDLTETFPQPAERLWASLVEPAELARWWGPHGFTTSATVDSRPGGRYRLTMQPPVGHPFHVTGRFLAIDPPGRLSYTFLYEEPGADDHETVVVLTLADVDDGTRVSLWQGPFLTEERRQLHRTGWTESFQRLRSVVG
jgi:uncharacterized protein YndB with AHSA1/START domain